MDSWPPALLEAKEALEPLFRAAGYRLIGLEKIGDTGRSATAEYRTTGRQIRIVCEGDENAIWIDTAAERDAQIVSPWTDIEWLVTGKRLPPAVGITPERIGELVESAAGYLAANAPLPRPPDTRPS